MQTPKFPKIANELSSVLSSARFSHVWKKKIRLRLRLSPLRDPIDHFDFHLNFERRTRGLSTQIKDGRYSPSIHKRYKVEKSKGLCRQLVVPAVADCLVLQVLSDSLFVEIKNAQPTTKAYFLPDDGNFNKKFEEVAASPYGSLKAWIDFQQKLFEFPKQYKYIVVTDVANYYDFIKFDHLRNVISGFTQKAESLLDILIFVLAGLSWQPDYMPRQSTGLPQIDIDAPRLLAHCFLFEVDEFVENSANLNHVRFMDDIDIGADSIAEAKKVLRDVDTIIQSRQVRLNSGKTIILSAEEAIRHFMIRENHILSVWQRSIDKKIKASKSIARDQRALVSVVKRGLAARRFDVGNGEKVLKRLITTANKTNTHLRLDDLDKIIRLRPNARSAALRHLARRELRMSEVRKLHQAVLANQFIDDQGPIDVVRALLEARVRKDKRISFLVRQIADYLLEYSEFGIFLAQRLAARYLTPGQALYFTGKRRSIWEPDPVLGRFMASALPFFIGTRELGDFRRSISVARNVGAEQIFEFYDGLIFEDVKPEVFNYCKSPNPTLPLGANFEKISMLIALHHNKNLAPSKRDQLFKPHNKLLNDPYYRSFFGKPV